MEVNILLDPLYLGNGGGDLAQKGSYLALAKVVLKILHDIIAQRLF